MFVFLYVRAHSKKICEEISFSSFFPEKCWCQHFCLDSRLLSYLEKCMVTPISVCGFHKDLLFCVLLAWCKNLCISVDTVLKSSFNGWFIDHSYSVSIKTLITDITKQGSNVPKSLEIIANLPTNLPCSCLDLQKPPMPYQHQMTISYQL